MIKYLNNNYPSFITLFDYQVFGDTEEECKKKLMTTIRKCQAFAKGINIHFHSDCYLYFDGEASIRLVFQVKEPQDTILIKMSALFNFATSLKIILINNNFFPEKT